MKNMFNLKKNKKKKIKSFVGGLSEPSRLTKLVSRVAKSGSLGVSDSHEPRLVASQLEWAGLAHFNTTTSTSMQRAKFIN